MAKPSHDHETPRLLVTELWGLGDVALAIPFLRSASVHAEVTLLAKPHAAPLLRRFAPAVTLVPVVAPWTAFRGKYRLHTWPWRSMLQVIRGLRATRFTLGASARPDPRDHAFLRAAGVARLIGFPRAGSGAILHTSLNPPLSTHRSAYWNAIASTLCWPVDSAHPRRRHGRKVVCHVGAARSSRQWGDEKFAAIAGRLSVAGWEVKVIDERSGGLDELIDVLADADRFIGNDSGPGHLAALLGVPTFTIFGPQSAEAFRPVHPDAGSIEGRPCPFKPCNDYCRFPVPHCIRELTVDGVWQDLNAWLARTS